MKTTNVMIVCGALLIMSSCDNTARDNERNEAREELKSFVDSVESVADDRIDVDWTDLDRRYNTLEQRAENAYMDADDTQREELMAIEAEYEEIKVEAKNRIDEMNRTTEMHLERVEDWRENRTTTTGNAYEEMDDTVQESVDWLEENFEQLGDEMRARYESIRAEVRSDDNTTNPGTNPG
nr:hypothetical protein [Cytophagales bacterium]